MNKPNELEVIRNSDEFDADWYLEKYKDVKLTGMDPHEHFFRYGGVLKRSPGPDFDTRFCLSTYQDMMDSDLNPLVNYLLCEDKGNRPVTRRQAEDVKKHEESLSARKWGRNDEGDLKRLDVSYCITIMGRLSDLKETLHYNLKSNYDFSGRIEFLIIELGKGREVQNWCEEKFPSELSSGYLRVLQVPDVIDTWHFGKAKNSFRPHLRGKIYSSLDGDNYVTSEETRVLLSLNENHPNGFVFHHFSGSWGDGTSGRVSMPTWIYQNVGYDEKMLPRQFDEMDLMLGALIRYPFVPFIGVNSDKNAFTHSAFCKKFRENEGLPNQMVFTGEIENRPPLNPRGLNYTQRSPHWSDMNNYNATCSAARRTSNSERREKYLDQASQHKMRLLESIPKNEVMDAIFWTGHEVACDVDKEKDTCLLVCVKNDSQFLKDLIEHYASVGVTKFFIVDDGSNPSVDPSDFAAKVVVLKPKVGCFRTAKTLWLEAAMKAFIPEGTWVLTVDADEFVQLPENYDSISDVIVELEREGKSYAPGILLDMVPAPGKGLAGEVSFGQDFAEVFDHFCCYSGGISEDYRSYHSIKWGFGLHADISWRYDARHHMFGTFDSLRKFPLFKYDSTRHLNQGFHTFQYIGGNKPPSNNVWKECIVLPIFHYKLAKLFSSEERKAAIISAQGYHSRTQSNIINIFGSEVDKVHEGLRKVSKHVVHKSELYKDDIFCGRASSRNRYERA